MKPAIALNFQAETHKCTQEAIYIMWKARNTAKHGLTTQSGHWELKAFEAAIIKSWKTEAERKGKAIVDGSEARIRTSLAEETEAKMDAQSPEEPKEYPGILD